MRVEKLFFVNLVCLLLMAFCTPSLRAVVFSAKDAESKIIAANVPMSLQDFEERSNIFCNIWINICSGVYGDPCLDTETFRGDFSEFKNKVLRDTIVGLSSASQGGTIGLLVYEKVFISEAKSSSELVENLKSLMIAYDGLSKNFERLF